MKYLVDIHDKELYVGAEVIFSDPNGYLRIATITKFTPKSVVMDNGYWVNKEKAQYRILIS